VTFYDAAAAAAAPSGMASLDVELPRRGTMYRFTTPRGKVEIKAMAASQPLIEGIERLGAVVALIVLVLVVRRILRRQSMSLRAQNILATVLIILGIVGVTFGLLPVVGVLAVFAGVIMKVRLYRIRRRPAVTA
jgi:heme A synthase